MQSGPGTAHLRSHPFSPPHPAPPSRGGSPEVGFPAPLCSIAGAQGLRLATQASWVGSRLPAGLGVPGVGDGALSLHHTPHSRHRRHRARHTVDTFHLSARLVFVAHLPGEREGDTTLPSWGAQAIPDDVPGQAAWTVRSTGNTGCASAEDGVGMASPCRRRGSEKQVVISVAEEPRRAFQARGQRRQGKHGIPGNCYWQLGWRMGR